MNENYARHPVSTFRHMDNLLQEAEHMYAREAIRLTRDKIRVWSTVTEDLPPLIAELEKIL